MSDETIIATTNERVSTPPQADAPQWFWSENVPGTGPRPDYLPEKYKSVADAAMARGELEKKLGGFVGAPEKYELEHLGADVEQHSFKAIVDVAKELNMSQAGLDKLVGRMLTAMEAEEKVSLESEIAKLGDDGVRQLKQYENFANNHLKKEEAAIVKNWIQSAGDLKIFNALVKNVYSSRIPTTEHMHINNGHESVADLKAEMSKNIGRFGTDKSYREDWNMRLGWAKAREDR